MTPGFRDPQENVVESALVTSERELDVLLYAYAAERADDAEAAGTLVAVGFKAPSPWIVRRGVPKCYQ